MCAVEKLPVKIRVGHVIPQCLMTDRIPIKLQLTGKSRLIFKFSCRFFNIERTQLIAAHAQLLEKLRPIAFVETCRFLTILSLEFQEIWQKNSSQTTQMIYYKKSEF